MTHYTQKNLNGTAYWQHLHNNPDNDAPTVIMMHWMTGTAEAMAFVFDNIDFPLREISLQGNYPSGYPEGGQSWFEHETDFYEKLSDAEQEPLIRQEVDKVAQFINAIRQQYSGKLVVTGMSQGGDMTLHLASYYPELLDLALPMAGRLSKAMRPASIESDKLPTIKLLQGLNDEIVLVETARDVAQWLTQHNYPTTLNEYPDVGHSISPDMIQDIQNTVKAL